MPRSKRWRDARRDAAVTNGFFGTQPVSCALACTCCNRQANASVPASAAFAEVLRRLHPAAGQPLPAPIIDQIKEVETQVGFVSKTLFDKAKQIEEDELVLKSVDERATLAAATATGELTPQAIEHFSDGAESFKMDTLERAVQIYEKKYDAHSIILPYRLSDDRDHSTTNLIETPATVEWEQHLAQIERIFAECDLRRSTIAKYLSLVQLFNAEKRFGEVEEKYYILKNDVDKQQNKPHFEGDPPRTLREIWNNPAILCKKPLKEAPKKQTKETPKKEKKSDALLATAQLKRHMKEVTSNMPALKRAVTAAEKITLPQVPSHFAQYGVLIPATVSKEILQRLFDLEFLFQEIVDLQELVVRERDRIRATFLIWSTAGRACWNYGKTRIFELKDMRKYEYDRVSLLSACYVAMREEVKIFEYFRSGEGSQQLTPELSRSLAFETRDPQQYWTEKIEGTKSDCASVEEMIALVKESVVLERS